MNVITKVFGGKAVAPQYQGYLDTRSTQHVAGWMRNLADAQERLAFEVVLPLQDGERILAQGVANTHSDVLVAVGVGDGGYAFEAVFDSAVSRAERETIFVRPKGSAHRLELAPDLRREAPGMALVVGYVDERSIAHVSGWARNDADYSDRVEIEIVLPLAGGGEKILGRLVANHFSDSLRKVGVGDGTYAFFVRFDAPVTEAEREQILVRPAGSERALPLSPALRDKFEPIHHVAMDIVNNCNLRCPFCVFDYGHTHKTYVMSDETFDAALRLIPYVTEGNFWLSCLHEATLHPRLVEFIERVPQQYRKKLFFTTNLAKRMPRSYFETLANSGMSHINISVESLDPVVYERMRAGARHRIFMENWATLLEIFTATPNAPRIRYNMMAYRSNLLEIPQFAEFLLREKSGWQIEIRNTFDEPHITREFRDKEFLDTREWAWLDAQMKKFPADEVILLLPPNGEGFDRYQPANPAMDGVIAQPYDRTKATHNLSPGPVPRPFNVRIAWDGELIIYSELPRTPDEPPTHANYLITNIRDLEDPMGAFFALK